MIRLLFTSGWGPAECRMALAHALRRVAAEAEAADCDCAIAPLAENQDRHGPGAAIVVLAGAAESDIATRWTSGSVQWAHKSPLRPGLARKNWFIGVFELPSPREAKPFEPSEIRFESFRAGGPGGQHQNKTESAVRAIHSPTGLSATARDGRSQHRNKALAIERLEALLNAKAQIQREGETRLIHATHQKVERGAAGLRFEGPDFRPAAR
jgi:peptide chain release factor